MADASEQTDIVVIGGGPAGSTVASLLVEQGWTVTLLERDRHPRFHIGESLLPMNMPLLERLGVLEQVREIGLLKHGAEFNADWRRDLRRTSFFRNALDASYPYAFEVRRSEFDALLLQNSRAKGVTVHEAMRARDVEFAGDGSSVVHAVSEAGDRHSWRSRFLVDASGRDTLLASKFGTKRKDTRNASAALFGHFEGVVRRPGADEGNISLYWFAHGWFWLIPLRDGTTSVGAVCDPAYLRTRRRPPDEFLWQTIRKCPGVYNRMRRASLVGKVRATGNYSYAATHMYGRGYLLVGDAFAFVDPVFSTGVYLAMQGAEFGARAIDRHLRHPRRSLQPFRQVQRRMRRGMRLMNWFVYRFNSPAMRLLLMNPSNAFNMQRAVLSLLAGDVFRRTPLRVPLLALKASYYLLTLKELRSTLRTRAARKRSVKLTADDDGLEIQ